MAPPPPPRVASPRAAPGAPDPAPPDPPRSSFHIRRCRRQGPRWRQALHHPGADGRRGKFGETEAASHSGRPGAAVRAAPLLRGGDGNLHGRRCGGRGRMGGSDGCGSGVLSRSVSVRPWPAGGARRTGEGRLEAPCRRADGGPRLHGEAPFGSSQLRGWGTRLPVKIASTSVMADDGGVYDVVPFSRHHCCRSRHHTRDPLRETLVWVFMDRMMMTSSMPLSLLWASFWSKCLLESSRGGAAWHLPYRRRRVLAAGCT